MSGPRDTRLLASLFRRLLPGRMGAEACEELERQHAQRRDRHGRVLAWLWYAAHFLRPDTWKLAVALRRQRRKKGSRTRRSAFISILDVKLGVRMLFKNPGLTLVSGLAMAVSIAIGVGCFTFFQDFLLRPTVPLPEGDRIVSLGLQDNVTQQTERRLLHDFVAWREELESVEDVGAWREVTRNLVAPDGRAEPVRIAEMSAAGFRVARVPPLLGRPLLDADEVEGAPPVIVIGYDTWQRRFDGDRDVIGRTLQIGREQHTVVGVMPEDFGFPLANDLWVPLRWNPNEHEPLMGSGRAFAFGRLAPEATWAEAEAEMAVLTARRAAELPETHERLRGLVMPYTDTHTGMEGVGPGTWMLVYGVLAFITMILAIPFVNVAILVYARTARRAGEIALRNALGASRRRVVSQLFVEALLLSACAAVAGLALALYGLERGYDVMALEFGGTPFWSRQGRNPATVMYALVLTVLAAIVAGVIPGLKATGKGVQSNLARLAGGNGMRLGGVWTALVVAQVGTTVTFVPPAVSLAWIGVGESLVQPAFPMDDLLVAGLAQVPGSYDSGNEEEEVARTPVAEVLRRLEEEPAVGAITYASSVPGSYFEASLRLDVEGTPSPEGEQYHRAGSLAVAEEFFDVLEAEIVSGRGFRRGDADAEAVPALVNRTFVQQILGDRNAVGRHLRIVRPGETEPGPWIEIVGVVEDLTNNPMNPHRTRSRVFTPLPPPESLSRANLILRMRSSPADFAPRLRQITTAVDPTIRVDFVAPLADYDDPIRSVLRVAVVGIVLAVLSVLLLATAGIYALMSFNVTQRRREIGIRSALGAHPRRVLAGIFSRAAVQLGIGGLVGIAGAVLLERMVVQEMVSGPRPGMGLLLLVAMLMVGVGLLAAVGPARRGLRIEPREALRDHPSSVAHSGSCGS